MLKRTVILLGVLACNPSHILGSGDTLAPGQADPKATQNPAGAMEAYNATRAQLNTAYGAYGTTDFVITTGLLSDELESGSIGAPRGIFATGMVTDSRQLPQYRDPALEPQQEPYIQVYTELHSVRSQSHQAIGLLQQYDPKAPVALVGHLHALTGYAEVMLADLYCSGIPLSTLDYGGDYTLEPGSSTSAVYSHAVAQFDSAITLAKDSVRILHLAQIGKGRALLALGQFAAAAAAVSTVPDGYQYAETYQPNQDGAIDDNFGAFSPGQAQFAFYTVADREGGTGLDYMSSNDPRTATTAVMTNQYNEPDYFAAKYATDGSSPVVLADWIEARLIEAEASLAAGRVADWLNTINHLRETAIVPALADTTDPGSAGARVNLLFRERAFWLFLTGHRLGDMRRLVRQYGRLPTTVFPIGPYAGANGAYGSAVNAPVPAAEFLGNPKFTGCINRGA